MPDGQHHLWGHTVQVESASDEALSVRKHAITAQIGSRTDSLIVDCPRT